MGMYINIDKSNISYNKILDEEVRILKELTPFPLKPLSKGFKYLGFILNPNLHSFNEWLWLYKKVEVRLSCLTNWFLYRGVRIVLLKAVL